jgi:hypothetical protein
MSLDVDCSQTVSPRTALRTGLHEASREARQVNK